MNEDQQAKVNQAARDIAYHFALSEAQAKERLLRAMQSMVDSAHKWRRFSRTHSSRLRLFWRLYYWLKGE